MQQWLGIYVEPVPGNPATYESEDKRFFRNEEELKELVKVARSVAASLKVDVERVLSYETRGFTYKQATADIMSSNVSIDALAPDDSLFKADEDLVFLYWALYQLWYFINEAETAIDKNQDIQT
jgi:hypothetical protein